MKKFARLIVDHKNIIMLLFIGAMVFCVWGMSQVQVEYSITEYLPESTDTKQALRIMDDEFVTHGSATIMLRNIPYETAENLHRQIEELNGVKEFNFYPTDEYYKNSCALFQITFEGNGDDTVSAQAYEQTLELLREQDVLISVSLLDTYADELKSDINFVLILAVFVIVAVLIFTSKSFAEVGVFLIVFAVAALLNMGTNFFLGTISFISNSVCVILQLALAIDYAIILCHRFSEEKELHGGDSYEGIVNALAKSIVEISGSSLTTIAGLLALTTMALRLGADLGIVLTKSILCSMLTVFLFMPGIILLFSGAIDHTRHRNFVPSIRKFAKTVIKLRIPIVILFAITVTVGTVYSFRADYCYSSNSIDTSRPSDAQVATREIESVFGKDNQFVILVPGHDYAGQLELLNMVESHQEIDTALGIANVELTLNGQSVYLTEQLNYKRFAALLSMDENTADGIYSAYAFFSKPDTKGGLEEIAVFEANKQIYTASLLEMCDCAFAHDDFISAYLYHDSDSLETYQDLRDTVQDAEDQLIGTNYSRMVFNMTTDVEGEDSFALIERLQTEVKSVCPGAIFAGDSMSAYDLDRSFSTDNIKVSLISVLAVFVILMLSFRSWGLPLPLVLTIQGAIFVNFAYYALSGTNIFFFVYLIVNAIQMGATIDYAIVTTNRYTELRRTMESKDAMVEAVNGAFPTVITSGTIMAVAGFLIAFVVRDPLIATLGACLGRGVIISILGVLLVIPSLLVLSDRWLMKTKFKEHKQKEKTQVRELRKLLERFYKQEDSDDET